MAFPLLGALGSLGSSLAPYLPYLGAVGTGAVGGKLASSGGRSQLGKSLLGSEGQTLQTQRFGPEQISALNQLLQQGISGLGQQKPFDFAPIAQQAREQFAQQTVPSLAERFTALGGQRSSAFPQALGQAGSQLESNLAAQGAQFGMQGQDQQNRLLLSLLGLGLTPQFENAYRPGTPGLLGSAAQSLPLLALLGGK